MRKAITFLIISLIILIGLVLLMFIQSLRPVVMPRRVQAADSPVEIRFVSSWARYNGLAEILKRFNTDNRDYQVIDDSIAGKDFLNKLKTDFASGNDPDVFALWPGSDIDNLIQKEKIVKLNLVLGSKFVSLQKLIKSQIWDMIKKGNDCYSIPLEIICEGLFINRKLFNQYNIKVPANRDELFNAVEKFKAASIIPIAFSSTPEGSFIYQNIIIKLGGSEAVNHPFREGRIHPSYIKAMKVMKELNKNGAFPDNFYMLDDIARDNMFLEQKAAMIVQGSWFIYFIERNTYKDNFEFHPFPSFDNSSARARVIYGLGSGNFHISRKAWDNKEKREAVLTLLETLISEQSIQTLAKDSGFFSSIEYEIESTSSLRSQALDVIRSAGELIPPVDNSLNRSLWEGMIVPSLLKVMVEDLDPEEIFSSLEGKH